MLKLNTSVLANNGSWDRQAWRPHGSGSLGTHWTYFKTCVCLCTCAGDVRARSLSIRSCSPHPCYSMSFSLLRFSDHTFWNTVEHSDPVMAFIPQSPSHAHTYTYTRTHTYGHTAKMPAWGFLLMSGGNGEGGGKGPQKERLLEVGEHAGTCTQHQDGGVLGYTHF